MCAMVPQQHRLLNFGLIAVTTIPLGIALLICGHSIYIIWPDLTPPQRSGMVFGLVLVSLPGIMATILSWLSLRKKTPLPKSRLVALLVTLILCLYIFLRFVEPHVFFREWMFDHDNYLIVIISGLIPLFYYLLFYLAAVLAITTPRALVISIVSTVLIPVVAYLGFNLIRFMPNFFVDGHVWQLTPVTLTAAFSFFILRLLIYMIARNSFAWTKPGTLRIIQFLFIGVFPFIGLTLNAWGPVARESQMALGTFNAAPFWILAAVNALIYLLPEFPYYPLRFALLALRTAGFIFVLYFCTVFILFLPLALMLIVAIGLGLLLLIPYFTAAVQLLRLRRDYVALAESGRKSFAIIALISGAILLPAATLAHIYNDRVHLTSAIRFIEQPPLTLNHESGVDAETVLRLAAMAPPSTNRGLSWRHNPQNTPIYDALYRSIVFDGAELSETLRKRIKLVFGGVNEFMPTATNVQPQTELGEVAISTKTDGQLTQSTLRVVIENKGNRESEFSQRIDLPAGAFLSGHWLTIDGVEVPAQITNKNTAIWVFNRVVEARRDPSLIYYEGRDALRWRVFPVPAAGTRQARLQISHAHDTDMRIAGKKFHLKAISQTPVLKSATGKVHLIGAAAAEDTVVRKPYLHFIADCGKNAQKDYTRDVQIAAQELGLNLKQAQVSFTNTAIRTLALPAAVTCPAVREGFFADRAVRAILHAQFNSASENYPVLVVLSNERLAVNGTDLSYIAAFYGDADGFAYFDGKKLQSFNFLENRITLGAPRLNQPVRLYGGRYFAAAQQLVFPAEISAPATATPILDGFEQYYDFYLGQTDYRGKAVLTAVETGVLNPAAGSIVLETEAQRRKLAELHKKMLNARNQLDTGEQPRMSEPWGFIFVALAFLVFVIFYRRAGFA
jgi:hypothetical protein